MIYAGNNGLEVESPTLQFAHPQAPLVKTLIGKIKDRLKQTLKSMRGIWVEDGVFSLNIHYAKAAPKKAEEARTLLEKVARPYVKTGRVVLAQGLKTWEIRPTLHWNKGTTALWLYGRVLAQSSDEKILPIYVGDDRTDEDAFRSLKPVGVSVKVAREEGDALLSDADYFLRSPEEVFEFLERLKTEKTGAPLSVKEKLQTVS